MMQYCNSRRIIAVVVVVFSFYPHLCISFIHYSHRPLSSSTSSSSLSPCVRSMTMSTSPNDKSVVQKDDNAGAAAAAVVVAAPSGLAEITWEPKVAEMFRTIITEKYDGNHDNDTNGTIQPSPPYMVAIVGIPGSGKSTSGTILGNLLKDIGCLVMPFDGYHYAMRDLKNFPNPDDVIYRRGAPDTFDVHALKRDLHKIRYGRASVSDDDEENIRSNIVHLPGFDHSVGDPEDNAIVFIREEHKIVITEGLYLLHDADEWNDVKDFFDYTIYVDADIDVSMARLKERNKVIPGYTVNEIEIRVDAVDRLNALTVEKTRHRANLVVESAAFTHERRI